MALPVFRNNQVVAVLESSGAAGNEGRLLELSRIAAGFAQLSSCLSSVTDHKNKFRKGE